MGQLPHVPLVKSKALCSLKTTYTTWHLVESVSIRGISAGWDHETSPPISLPSQVQEERILHQQVKCIITEEKVCMVCKKKIGNRWVSFTALQGVPWGGSCSGYSLHFNSRRKHGCWLSWAHIVLEAPESSPCHLLGMGFENLKTWNVWLGTVDFLPIKPFSGS